MGKIKLHLKKYRILIVVVITVIALIGIGFGTYKYNKVQAYNNLVTTANKYMAQGDYDKAEVLFEQSLKYKNDSSVQKNIKLATTLKKFKGIYNDGMKLINNKKYLEAIEKFKTIDKSGLKWYTNAQKEIKECKKQYIAQNIQLANDSAKNNKYNDAIKYLDEVLELDANNSEAKDLKNTFKKMLVLNSNIRTQKISGTNSERGNGNIKGVITWQYNNFVGTKPDNGANIVLISKNKDKNSDNATFTLTLKQNPNGKNGIYTAEADGYGNYEMDDVPVGQYYLLIKSNKTNSNMTIDANTASVLQGLFSENDWNKLQNILKLNKYLLKTVEIKPTKTIIENYDFGYTYF